MRRSRGLRNKTRHILHVSPRNRGKLTITATMRPFKVGDRAAVVLEPRVHAGMPHRRFQGTTAVVLGHQGKAVVVQIYNGNKAKKLIVRPEHLQPL